MSFLSNYNKYNDKIFNYFLYRVNFNRELAEDLCSEVFLKAYEKIDTYDPQRPFQAWIYRIAHNHLANHYRDTKYNSSIEEMKDIGKEIKDNKFNRLLLAQTDTSLLLKEINKLPTLQADILLYRYIDQLEYSDIANITGENEGNIRVIVHRTIATLKDLLNNDE